MTFPHKAKSDRQSVLTVNGTQNLIGEQDRYFVKILSNIAQERKTLFSWKIPAMITWSMKGLPLSLLSDALPLRFQIWPALEAGVTPTESPLRRKTKEVNFFRFQSSAWIDVDTGLFLLCQRLCRLNATILCVTQRTTEWETKEKEILGMECKY